MPTMHTVGLLVAQMAIRCVLPRKSKHTADISLYDCAVHKSPGFTRSSWCGSASDFSGGVETINPLIRNEIGYSVFHLLTCLELYEGILYFLCALSNCRFK